MGVPWAEVSVGVAAIVGLIYVARTMRHVSRDTLKFLGNHMSGVTKSLGEVSVNLARLNEKVDRVSDDCADRPTDRRTDDSFWGPYA